MSCLQHAFCAHPTLQRWLFCTLCGAAKEIGAETRARASQPRQPRRKREPEQMTFDDERQRQNDLEADAFIAQREAEALRRLAEAGVDTSEGIEGIIARNREGTTHEEVERSAPPHDEHDGRIATSTSFYG